MIVAVVIAALGESAQERDTAIGVVPAFGLGVGVLLPSDYHGFATAATNILLGNIFGASNSRSLPPTAGSC